MTQNDTNSADLLAALREKLLDAALPHVAFDGWSMQALQQAAQDVDETPQAVKRAFPRGGVDLALAFHDRGDAALADALAKEDLSTLRYSERVARAIELRLELIAPQKEAVRRAAALFALPMYAPAGAQAIWRTADTIWVGLGDTASDVNWYTKRVTLSAVWSAVLLFWLGDDSPDMEATRAFVARRIEDVMRFEKSKHSFRSSPLGRFWATGPGRILDGIKAPSARSADLPGRRTARAPSR